MASCPKCNYKLKAWNIRAECPKCGVNIPNYDWENRLEEDNRAAEEAYYQFHLKLSRIRYALLGTTLRKLRVPIGALPLLSFLLPMGKVVLEFPFTGQSKTLNILTAFGTLFGADFGTITALASSDIFGSYAQRFLFAFFPYLLCVLIPPITLLIFIVGNKRLRSRSPAFFNLLGAGGMLFSALMMQSVLRSMSGQLPVISGDLNALPFVTVALFLAAAALNFVIAAKPIHEDFETQAKEKAKFSSKK